MKGGKLFLLTSPFEKGGLRGIEGDFIKI